MTDKQILIKEIETLPPHTIEEVFNFVSFLKIRKTQERNEDNIHIASEKALAVDWLLPEEDIAWANL